MPKAVVGALAHVLCQAGVPREDAVDLALRLAAEGYRASRGLVDGPAFLTAEESLRSAGLTVKAANAIAIALGQRGYRIIGP